MDRAPIKRMETNLRITTSLISYHTRWLKAMREDSFPTLIIRVCHFLNSYHTAYLIPTPAPTMSPWGVIMQKALVSLGGW